MRTSRIFGHYRITLAREFSTKIIAMIALILALQSQPAAALDWVGVDLDGKPCQGNGQGFGPYDYFDVNEESDPKYQEGRYWELDKVHTDKAVGLMRAGSAISQGAFQLASSNLDYSLRAIPNDPRSLQEVIRLDSLIRQNPRLVNPEPPPECYFQRAVAFRGKQAHVRLLYAVYLHKLGHYLQSIPQYEAALAIDPNSAESHYNIALALIKLDKESWHWNMPRGLMS